MMEAMTDPNVTTGIRLNNGDEICDGEAQSYARAARRLRVPPRSGR